MKKSFFVLPLATLALLTTPLAKTTVSANHNPRIQLYIVNKSRLHHKGSMTVNKTLFFSKHLHYHGKTYYYLTSKHAYANHQGYRVAIKYDQNLAKKETKKFNQASKNSTKPAKNTTPKQNKIVNGYDETKQTIVDKDTYAKVATQAAINKLNSFRESKGLQPLTVDPGLSQIAQMRAQEEANYGYDPTNFDGHRTSDGTLLLARDAQQLGIMSYNQAYNSIYENAGLLGLDDTNDGTPEEVGEANIQAEIDEGPTGGHYQTDVTPSLTKVGIGTYFKNDSTIGYTADLE